MRDWTKTLPNASFRGVPFFVEEDSLADAGRRVATHEFVKSEDHATEDMGRKTRHHRVRAYIVGDAADSDAQALADACDVIGDGTLQTLFWGAVTVKCTGCNGTGKRDALGSLWFDLEFVASGNDSAFAVTAIGDRIAASTLATLGQAIFAALSGFAG